MSGHARVREQLPTGHTVSSSKQAERAVQVIQRTPIGATLYRRMRFEPRSLSRAEVLVFQRTLGNRAVTQLFKRTAHQAGQAPLQKAASPQPQASTGGLPTALKAGVENLSGLSMGDVRVHYNSAKPAKVEALAYTQGTDIHVGPGQEQHLAHEAWHVVQQKHGRVQPTMQAKGAAINDDGGLEHEADVMVARAAQMRKANTQVDGVDGRGENVLQPRRSATDAPIQRVYGGLEYTEGGSTTLNSYGAGVPPAPVAPVHTATVGVTPIGFYHVAQANLGIWVGAWNNNYHTILTSAAPNHVKLTNDVSSAEWVIEGHTVHGLTQAGLMTNMTNDIGMLYTLRQSLANGIANAKAAAAPFPAGDQIVLAPNATVILRWPGPEGLFIYKPDAANNGKVQITVQYENLDTIRRIAKLNASKYLTGSKKCPRRRGYCSSDRQPQFGSAGPGLFGIFQLLHRPK